MTAIMIVISSATFLSLGQNIQTHNLKEERDLFWLWVLAHSHPALMQEQDGRGGEGAQPMTARKQKERDKLKGRDAFPGHLHPSDRLTS